MEPEKLEMWVKETCRSLCTSTDLRLICRERGFTPPKGAKKESLAEYVEMRLTSEQGVTQALATVDAQSLWALHAMASAAEDLPISSLYHFYGFAAGHWVSAVEYKRRFQRIQQSLVCKGLMLMRTVRSWDSSRSRYERIAVYLPEVVAGQLPKLPVETVSVAEQPTFADWTAPVLKAIFDDMRSSEEPVEKTDGVLPKTSLENGELRVGGIQPPTVAAIHDRMLKRWLGFDKSKATEQRQYLLAAIEADQAIHPDKLRSAFARFNCPIAAAGFGDFVRLGLQYGFLAEVTIDEDQFLVPRIALPESPTGGKLEFTTLTDRDDCVIVAQEEITLSELCHLALVSRLRSNGALLHARPSLIRIGQTLESLRASPWWQALLSASGVYRQASGTVEKRDGKIRVHSGLTVIRLGGLDISAQVKHAFGDRMAALGDGYFAIGRNDLAEITRFAKQRGFHPKFMTEREAPTP